MVPNSVYVQLQIQCGQLKQYPPPPPSPAPPISHPLPGDFIYLFYLYPPETAEVTLGGRDRIYLEQKNPNKIKNAATIH